MDDTSFDISRFYTGTSGSDTNAKIIERFWRGSNRTGNLPMLVKKATRNLLAEFLRDEGFNKGAEIGVQWGRFSERLCISNPNIELYSVDPWRHKRRMERLQEKYETACKRLEPYNCTVIRKTSMEALADFKDASLDFVYIDGNHTFDYVVTDLVQWSYKVREGGIIALHDYYHFGGGGVVEAVDAYTRAWNINPWFVTYEVMPTVFWVNPRKRGAPR